MWVFPAESPLVRRHGLPGECFWSVREKERNWGSKSKRNSFWDKLGGYCREDDEGRGEEMRKMSKYDEMTFFLLRLRNCNCSLDLIPMNNDDGAKKKEGQTEMCVVLVFQQLITRRLWG